jgi:hypothetical protein
VPSRLVPRMYKFNSRTNSRMALLNECKSIAITLTEE